MGSPAQLVAIPHTSPAPTGTPSPLHPVEIQPSIDPRSPHVLATGSGTMPSPENNLKLQQTRDHMPRSSHKTGRTVSAQEGMGTGLPVPLIEAILSRGVMLPTLALIRPRRRK